MNYDRRKEGAELADIMTVRGTSQLENLHRALNARCLSATCGVHRAHHLILGFIVDWILLAERLEHAIESVRQRPEERARSVADALETAVGNGWIALTLSLARRSATGGSHSDFLFFK